jgi:hypothetical protein
VIYFEMDERLESAIFRVQRIRLAYDKKKINDGAGSEAGHVRIYTWDAWGASSSWVQRGADILDIDGEAGNAGPCAGRHAGDRSGPSVSLSADGRIGAPYNDATGASAGHVRIYTWDAWDASSSWVQRGADIDGKAAGDYSGFSVSLSADGQTVAIGAYARHRAAALGSDAGHVSIYTWGASSWVQAGTDIDGGAAGDNSGWRVSLSADSKAVAIGAPNNHGSAPHAGHVRVYSLALP